MKTVLWFAALFGSALAVPVLAADTFEIAVTVDDLPAHGLLPPGMTRLGIAESHFKTFKAHKVGEAFGFVNAAKIKEQPGSEAVLDAWRKAGHPLGNHAYSHMNLGRAESLEAWQADVIAGEPDVASRMVGADWHYFRYPNLSASSGKRGEDALSFLKGRGYRVADVSVSFSDWAYTDAYARCVAKGDNATIDAMKAQYLHDVDKGIAQMKADSIRIYGRVIPQVLLTHIGGWSAVTLPDVLARLDAAGARYVSLAKAQSDPAYAESGGGGLFERVAKQKGIELVKVASKAPATPGPDPKSACM